MSEGKREGGRGGGRERERRGGERERYIERERGWREREGGDGGRLAVFHSQLIMYTSAMNSHASGQHAEPSSGFSTITIIRK